MVAVFVFEMNRMVTIMMAKMAITKIIRKTSVIVPFKTIVMVIVMVIMSASFAESSLAHFSTILHFYTP